MKKSPIAAALLAACASLPALATSYQITTTWYEPDTQPNDTIFVGSFDYDPVSHTVTNLQGSLSESMTGGSTGYPNDTMTWLTLGYQLVSWYDAALGGTFAATFKNSTTATFCDSALCGSPSDNWSPQTGVDVGGVYAGFPKSAKNPGNAYALIFVPDDPTTALTQSQLALLAYADCAAGGMMGAVCMTGTSVAGYGSVGTMSGYPLSQVITATAAVPEPASWALLLAGAGVLGAWRRRHPA